MSSSLSNPRSIRAWENFRQRITELGGEVLEPEYLGALKPHHCRCVNGHECWSRPNDVQQGDGICRACAAQSRVDPRSQPAWGSFRRRITELGGEVLETEWLGSAKPHRCRCAEGHECRPTPNNVKSGHGICKACAGMDPDVAWDNFRNRIAGLGGTVLEPRYLGKDRPHRCLCPEGHTCQPRPASIRDGNGMCLVCAGLDPAVAWAGFRERVTGLGGVVLEREWLGALTPHLCLCAAGHECKPMPGNIGSGQGLCRVCADRGNPVTAQRKAASWDAFRQRVAGLGGRVLEPEYLGSDEPHRCLCARGHECSPAPHSVQSGQGMCQVCAWQSQDVLYVVRDPVLCLVKFGITSRDGSARLRRHGYDGFTDIARLETGLPEGLAAHIEQKIILALRMAGASPVRGKEYFDDEHIALIENEILNWID